MKIEKLLGIKKDEKPLEDIRLDGGYTSIFRNIACIGDSLSSGEFEYVKGEAHEWHDKFEHSWGQYIARMTGSKVYNFSRGGMSAKEYMETFANSIGAFDINKKCEAYIIALGVNDLLNQNCMIDLGEIGDYEEKKETMSRYYQEIIVKYKEIAPDARFFFLTTPNEPEDAGEGLRKKLAHRDLIIELANKYKNSYVIDLYQYGPKYDREFKEKFYLHGHMNPMGYKLTGLMVASYIDYIIRSDFESFKQVGFINTDRYDRDLDK